MKQPYRIYPGGCIPPDDDIVAMAAITPRRRLSQTMDVMVARCCWVTDLRLAFRPLGIDPLMKEMGYYAQDWN